MIIKGDCLDIIEQQIAPDSIDLIYLDPPFNTQRSHGEFDDRWSKKYVDSAPPEMSSEITQLFNAVSKIHSHGMANYLLYMTVRLLAMHKVLKDTGAIYLHCNEIASHYLKLVMDYIFNKSNCRNEIIWYFYSTHKSGRTGFHRAHNNILFYAKSKSHIFNADPIRMPYSEKYAAKDGFIKKIHGNEYQIKINPLGKWPDSLIHMPIQYYYRHQKGVYPTQKPVKLIEKFVLASSNIGDTVLDPFCGSGTTLRAAQNYGRKFIGIDTNDAAIDLAKKRINVEMGVVP